MKDMNITGNTIEKLLSRYAANEAKEKLLMKEAELFATMPELLLIGDNNGIIYDREKFLIDGMQRTTNIEESIKESLIKTFLYGDDIPAYIKN